MAQELESVVSALARESAAYEIKRSELERALEGLLPDPSDAVSDLLSWSEEFGRDHAIELFQNDLHSYPADPEVTDELWPQRLIDVSRRIDELLDAQDRLDELTREREALAVGIVKSLPDRILNIQGQEFELDVEKCVLRDCLGAELELGTERELTLTQSIARDAQAEPHLPTSKPTPSRSR